jgi:hypothetical protein
VGKSAHHGTALLADGRTVFDKPLPDGGPQLRELFARLGRRGKVLVVVDQPASVGTLAVAVARASGCEVAYLPGLSMRRLADCHPGTGKTDARDAYVIADAARTMPHLLHSIDPAEGVRAELTMVWATTTTSPRTPPAPPTGCAACSPRSIRPWNVSWDRGCVTRRSWPCCRPSAPRSNSPKSAPRSSSRS